jgi:hypothetical protein
MRLLDQVADIDEGVRALRRRRSEAFTRRNARAIRELQVRGVADPELDALLAATALSSMVSRMAQLTFVQGEPWELDELVETLTRLWTNALRIG